MKIAFTPQNNNKYKKQELLFQAGLTPKIMKEIQTADILEISNKLAKKGIDSDFKNNKVIAWCSDKSIEIFETLNNKFGINLAFPRGIYVEDFENLNYENKIAYGLCNFFQTTLRKNSDKLIDGETVFFNTFETILPKLPKDKQWKYDWNNINEITDYRFAQKNTSTDHFLYTPLHEFIHVTHEERIFNKLINENEETAGNILLEKYESALDSEQIKIFQKKYGKKLSKICTHAKDGALETVACDIPRLIAKTLDKKTLMPTRNPFVDSPYDDLQINNKAKFYFFLKQDTKLNKILKNIWNGKFD